jgi:hypothetical protein
VAPKQEKRLQKAIERKGGASITISFDEPQNETLLFTKDQIERIERAKLMGKKISIRMSGPQVKANTEHHGGFLWTLAARLAPAILKGVAGAAAAHVASNILSRKKGQGLYLQKNGQCAKVQLVNGGGLYLAPHPRLHYGHGLFETDGSEVKGEGLLLGDNSPFKNVPLLNILL